MPTYIIQSQWTHQGIRSVKESAKRLDVGKKKLKEMGGEIKAFYLTTGSYDSWPLSTCPTMRRLQNTCYGLAPKAVSGRRR